MGIAADREVCIGAGMCVLHAPGVFTQDDERGLVVVGDVDGGADAVSGAGGVDGSDPAVRRAVEACPSGAITLAP
jgi:ferredoxin